MITIQFGKYKGKRIDSLPTSYLEWLLEECDIVKKNKELQNSILDVLVDRFDEVIYKRIKRMHHYEIQ